MGLANNWSGQGSQIDSTTTLSLSDLTISGILTVKNGSAASPSIGFASTPTTGIYRNSGALGFAVSGVKEATVTSGGLQLADANGVFNDTGSGNIYLSGDSGSGSGGEIRAYGGSHASKANTVEVLAAGAVIMTSEGTSAVANTLYLKQGFVGFGNSSPTTVIDMKRTGTLTLQGTAYGSNMSIVAQQANGTEASATATASGDDLLFIRAAGYYTTGTPAFTAGKAAIRLRAAEAFTNTANGTYISFETTPTGSTTRAEAARISSLSGAGIVNFAANTTLSLTGADGSFLNGGTQTYAFGSGANGLLMVDITTDGHIGLCLLTGNGNTVTVVSDPASLFTNGANTANKYCVTASGGTVTVRNNVSASTKSVRVSLIQMV